MKTYHIYSTRAAITQSISIPKCKNKLPINPQYCEAHTKSQFSTLINNMYNCKKRLFLHSVSRSTQISFTQLRVGFCNLNYDLYIKNCVETENCECCHTREDSSQYLL